MEQLKSFKDLHVWKKSADLAGIVYKATEKFPNSEMYGLANQMRRAVVSISSNIAEGFKRSHGKEKIQFYNIAYGSAAELESQIEIAKKLNFLTQESYQQLLDITIEISKMMDSLIHSSNKVHTKLACFLVALFLYSISYILYPASTQAASLYFEPNFADAVVSEEIAVTLYLDSPEGVNAIEGAMRYPSDFLELKEVSDGNSIVNFWIEKPNVILSGSEESQRDPSALPQDDIIEIYFAGAIPGGYYANRGKIFSMRFVAKKSGEATVSLENMLALLNDGQGTPAKLEISNFKAQISNLEAGEAVPVVEEIEDAIPPEAFTPAIGRDETVFDGRYFLVFATQDKGSGVDYYEVSEERGWLRSLFGPSEENFERGESPYLLKDQSLQSSIFVRAVDKKGNERLVFLSAQQKPLSQTLLTITFWVIVVLLIVLGGRRLLKKKSEYSI